MVAKIIGYLIGGLFVLGLLAPIPISLWMIWDRVTVLSSTEVEPALIESCHHRYRTSGSRSKGSWGPVAVTERGLKVKGDFTWSKKSWCESDIGDEVNVFVHPTDKSKNRINTFFQFWFLPIISTSFCLFFYPLSYRLKKKKKKDK
ncbi:hypothetical protein [Aliikangiella coralliicola]|uniref:DUF3592 domain-containing protein n=1 Tax=Aliikangiella coralliicola TaxID=2592383 RepID=A0A545UFC5_9GAMM|nr:hypothetical protein [Aliikangiella coralliicola]TQV88168.1 hypothetical protein FLL46_06470 [Aliikangiella coralliicola]